MDLVLNVAVVRSLLDGKCFHKRHLTIELRKRTMDYRCMYLDPEVRTSEFLQQKADDRFEIIKLLAANGMRLTAFEGMHPGQEAERHEFGFLQEVLRYIPMSAYMLPVTPALVAWLTGQGCDLVAAYEQSYIHDSNAPAWLKQMLVVARSAWPVSKAVARGAQPGELEQLLQQCSIDVLSITDHDGRTLLQIAAATDQGDTVEWLVKKKGADLDQKDDTGSTISNHAAKLGLSNILDRIRCLRKWQKRNKKKADLQISKSESGAPGVVDMKPAPMLVMSKHHGGEVAGDGDMNDDGAAVQMKQIGQCQAVGCLQPSRCILERDGYFALVCSNKTCNQSSWDQTGTKMHAKCFLAVCESAAAPCKEECSLLSLPPWASVPWDVVDCMAKPWPCHRLQTYGCPGYLVSVFRCKWDEQQQCTRELRHLTQLTPHQRQSTTSRPLQSGKKSELCFLKKQHMPPTRNCCCMQSESGWPSNSTTVMVKKTCGC